MNTEKAIKAGRELAEKTMRQHRQDAAASSSKDVPKAVLHAAEPDSDSDSANYADSDDDYMAIKELAAEGLDIEAELEDGGLDGKAKLARKLYPQHDDPRLGKNKIKNGYQVTFNGAKTV